MLKIMFFCRHCSNLDVHGDWMPPIRPQELILQLCSHADEARVSTEDWSQVEEEDWTDRQVLRSWSLCVSRSSCYISQCGEFDYSMLSTTTWSVQQHFVSWAINNGNFRDLQWALTHTVVCCLALSIKEAAFVDSPSPQDSWPWGITWMCFCCPVFIYPYLVSQVTHHLNYTITWAVSVLWHCFQNNSVRIHFEPRYVSRKPDKSEVEEPLTPCPYCSHPVPQTKLDCPQCKSTIPYCIVTVSYNVRSRSVQWLLGSQTMAMKYHLCRVCSGLPPLPVAM